MQNAIHYLFISCIHVMLVGLLWCLLNMYSTAYLLFLQNCTLYHFCIWHWLYSRKCSNNKGKKKMLQWGAIQPLQICLTRWKGREILEDTLTLNSEKSHSEGCWIIVHCQILSLYFLVYFFYFHFKFLIIRQRYVMVYKKSHTATWRNPIHFFCFLSWGIENNDFKVTSFSFLWKNLDLKL